MILIFGYFNFNFTLFIGFLSHSNVVKLCDKLSKFVILLKSQPNDYKLSGELFKIVICILPQPNDFKFDGKSSKWVILL